MLILVLVVFLWGGHALNPFRLSAEVLCRAVERADGGVSVICPAEDSRRLGESDAEFSQRALDRSVQQQPALRGRPFVDLPRSALPQDRSNRNNWRLRDGRIETKGSAGGIAPPAGGGR